MAILKNKKIFTKEEKEALWTIYIQDKSNKEIYNQLLEAYIPLVEIIASNTKAKLPPEIEIGDLLNDGFFGLVDAIDKFDESKGWKFETYASNRIRGEINDRLRDYDWVSRYSRLKFKQVSQTEQYLTEELQREPSINEIANRLNWTEEEVYKVQNSYTNSFSVNIDEYLTDSTHETFSLAEVLPDENNSTIDFSYDLAHLGSILESHLFSLEEHESIVIYLNIYEGLSFEQIADELEVKPSKIARIFENAISKLRDRFGVT